METGAVEAYLHEHIPLSAAMGTRVVRADPAEVRLEAPLEPNLNHRATAFGGSVAALAILAGWTVVHLRLRTEGVEARTVIQRSDEDRRLVDSGGLEEIGAGGVAIV